MKRIYALLSIAFSHPAFAATNLQLCEEKVGNVANLNRGTTDYAK